MDSDNLEAPWLCKNKVGKKKTLFGEINIQIIVWLG